MTELLLINPWCDPPDQLGGRAEQRGYGTQEKRKGDITWLRKFGTCEFAELIGSYILEFTRTEHVRMVLNTGIKGERTLPTSLGLA